MRPASKHTGRRPGPNTARALIEATARKQFANLGYDRTSMRQVALATGVDPALVAHYFRTKLDLFLAVVELPIDPASLIDYVVGDAPEGAGTRLAAVVLDVLDDEVRRRPIVGMVRAATAEPEAARLVRDFLTRSLVTPIAQRLNADQAEYRAGLVMSQIVGLTLARYIVRLEALTSCPRERLATDLGATFHRYLLGDLADEPHPETKGTSS